jgi:hypothetical protein
VTPLTLGGLWVLGAAATAFLPMRAQMVPGLLLLAAAPVLLVWIAVTHGWLWAAFGLFACVSMFRRPLRHLAFKVFGRSLGLPE